MKLALMSAIELGMYLAEKINTNDVDDTPFFDCDFAIAEIEDDWDLEDTKINSTGWHGLKRIDTGFDDWYNITLVVDYYGGGSFRCFQIGEDESDSVVAEKIANEITECLKYGEYYNEGMKLIVEFLEKEDADETH